MTRSTRYERIVRVLVRLLPEPVRTGHVDDTAAGFTDRYIVTRSTRGRIRAHCFAFPYGLDIKLASRMLVRQPALTLVAVFALTVGIPVGLLPLHVLDSLTKAPPVAAGHDLVIVRNHDASSLSTMNRPLHDFVQWREELSSFEDLGMWRSDLYNINAADGRGAPVRGAEVTASVFTLLRVPPLLGRPIDTADEQIGAPDVVVISHNLWRTQLDGRADIIGSTVRIGTVLHTVVGVMPEGFLYPVYDHLWLPFRYDPLAFAYGEGPAAQVMGRLAPGVSRNEAQAEIDALGRRLATESPTTHAQLRPQVVRYTTALTQIDTPEASMGILLLQVLAFLLLALACGNVGILVLARAATRTHEIAIRTALGASRGRIVMQLFIESLLLAVIAAGVGLLVLQAVARAPDDLLAGLPFWISFDVSARTAIIALSLAVVSAVIAGVVPALKATGKSVHLAIQRAASDRSGIRFGRGYSALIVGEVAVSVWCLAVGASLMPAAPASMATVGIPTNEFLFAAVRIPQVDHAGRQRLALLHEELVRRVGAEPGVGGVAVASAMPGMAHARRYVQVEGMPREAGAPAPAHLVNVAHVDVSFFDALEQPILSGRNFNMGDLGEDRSAVIVNRSFAERVLKGRNAIGQRLRYWTPGEEPGPWSLVIVGVTESLGTNTLAVGMDDGVYHVAAPGELHPVTLAVRVGNEPEQFTPRLRSIVGSIDGSALLEQAMPLDAVPDPDRRVAVLWTWLLAVLAGIAVVLASACLYALMSFTVSERTRECGIRAALGARPVRIVSVLVRRAFLQLAVGVATGAVLSVVALTAFTGQGAATVLRADGWPLTVLFVALAVVGVGMLACVEPTRRVLRIRPVDALKG